MSKVEALCRFLERREEFIGQVAHWETVPAKKGEYVPFPEGIDRRILGALKGSGIEEVYTHQRACYESVRQGSHTVVVTPTASGKTLCYNLPVLQTLLEDANSRALYIFPTKALSQDQQSELNLIIEGGELPLPVYTYDGDTPNSVRIAARKSGRIVISNPDMLHAGILPQPSEVDQVYLRPQVCGH